MSICKKNNNIIECKDCKQFIAYTKSIPENWQVEHADGICRIKLHNSTDNHLIAVISNDYCSYGSRKIKISE